jgi:phage-related minor tail protein
MQAYYAERLNAMQARATERPRELQDLDARIDRLRDRLDRGDSDMTADEIQTAIDRADATRRELQAQQPEAVQSAQALTMLPKAAAIYRRQIELGLSGNDREALKARPLRRLHNPPSPSPIQEPPRWFRRTGP